MSKSSPPRKRGRRWWTSTSNTAVTDLEDRDVEGTGRRGSYTAMVPGFRFVETVGQCRGLFGSLMMRSTSRPAILPASLVGPGAGPSLNE